MTKKDIAAKIAEKFDTTKTHAEECVNCVFECITDGLVKGEEISIAGFGKFVTVERAARTGRNPRTGESIKIAASTAAKFKVSKTLKDKIN